jgi:hypothetical protein
MTINLADLPAATDTYIDDEVVVKIKNVTRNLEANEEGTFTVEITNGPVRLRDLVLHIVSSDASNVLLLAPAGVFLDARETIDVDDPVLATDTPVGAMFVFFPQDDPSSPVRPTLEPNEVREHEFTYKGASAGDATISCHVHATVDVDDLFPRSNGTDGSKTVTILS